MIAQTWSVDRQWQEEHNKQKMDMGKREKDARNRGGGKEKEPGKAAKSRTGYTHTSTKIPKSHDFSAIRK